MAKKQPPKPLVSSVATTLRKQGAGVQPLSPEEVLDKKLGMLGVVDKALQKFATNLDEGKVSLTTSADLDRLIKLSLLLAGEANDIVSQVGVEETTSVVDTSYIDQLLDENDPEVVKMYEKLYAGMNKLNDVE